MQLPKLYHRSWYHRELWDRENMTPEPYRNPPDDRYMSLNTEARDFLANAERGDEGIEDK